MGTRHRQTREAYKQRGRPGEGTRLFAMSEDVVRRGEMQILRQKVQDVRFCGIR